MKYDNLFQKIEYLLVLGEAVEKKFIFIEMQFECECGYEYISFGFNLYFNILD